MFTIHKSMVVTSKDTCDVVNFPVVGQEFYTTGMCQACGNQDAGYFRGTGKVTDIQESGDFLYFADENGHEYFLEKQ